MNGKKLHTAWAGVFVLVFFFGFLIQGELLGNAYKGLKMAQPEEEAMSYLPVSADWPQTAESPQILLDHLTGTWVMEGTIAGKQITHDVEAAWVLDKNYVRLYELSRGKDATGKPLYEAIVLLEWEPNSGEYACLWLDTTGGGGLSANVIGHAKPSGNEIPFLFEGGNGSRIHNTFAYNEADDTWQWRIDNEREGELVPFARVTLRRK